MGGTKKRDEHEEEKRGKSGKERETERMIGSDKNEKDKTYFVMHCLAVIITPQRCY